MRTLFLGLAIANLLLMAGVFLLGLLAAAPDDGPSRWYVWHLSLGIASGLLAALVHVTVYTYFMATSKWLTAASERFSLPPQRFVLPAKTRKRRMFPVIMLPVGLTMLAMFIGAAEDPGVAPLWSMKLHLWAAAIAWCGNLLAAFVEYHAIGEQSRLMDEALAATAEPSNRNGP